ncbi:MAG: hypothetical protein CVU99_06735 [Firmicutes bacterium HGW-Firmicutes-4]|jgi:hypothetical protein|nr:MAG: hypothetical protein CVU99_06735 [Firmicutes bacterium HGW-Firmicutes-4]
MGKNYFTEDQQEELLENQYIKTVSEKTITYTKEFREIFSEEYFSGKKPSQILIEMRIDPHILGYRRINSIVNRVKKYEQRPEKFEDMRKKRVADL